MSRVLSAVFVLVFLNTPAEAQGPIVKYGKWLLVAASIGMNYQAFRSHDRADDAFQALEDQCFADKSQCALGPGGQYANSSIEGLYQSSLSYDRQARWWLVGGETALAGAAALFIWELTRPKNRPNNIPFEPEVRSMRGGTGVGFRMTF
jgi:hypothetical protein